MLEIVVILAKSKRLDCLVLSTLLTFAGNFFCSVHIAAVHSSVWGAEAAKLNSKCIRDGEGKDGSI